MAKYELVKETRFDGTIQYFIEKDGLYVNRSITFDLEQANRFFELAMQGKNLENIKETIKTIEVNENNEQQED